MERRQVLHFHPVLKPPGSVLVVKPSSFGDVIHTLPAIAHLKRAWPDTRISWLINPEWQPLLADHPDLERTILFPRGDFRGWGGWWKFHRWCRQVLVPLKPDLTLDFQGLLRSAYIGRASRPTELVGMTDAREGATWFYDYTARIPAGVPHAVERYLALAQEAAQGAQTSSGEGHAQTLEFSLPVGQPVETKNAYLAEDFVLLHPFARGVAKSLSSEQLKEFCQRLAPRQVVIVGRGGGKAVEAIPHVLNLVDQTSLPQLIWLIRRAGFVISVDSGPAHLAAALGKPMVAIHTWSDPRRVGPYHPTAWIWKNGRLFQRREMPQMSDAFFRDPPTALTDSDIDRISDLAISSSSFSA